MAEPNQDEIDRVRQEALRSPDPRRFTEKYEPRMKLYDDGEIPSLQERGTLLDEFLDPE